MSRREAIVLFVSAALFVIVIVAAVPILIRQLQSVREERTIPPKPLLEVPGAPRVDARQGAPP